MFGFFSSRTPSSQVRRPSRSFKPAMEALEDKTVPATFVVTNLNDAGMGSLRDAVAQANQAPGADQIDFAHHVTGSIRLTTGQIRITDPVFINGPGAKKLTIDGGLETRLIQVALPPLGMAGSGDVSISGVTLFRGQAGVNEGGAVLQVGGQLTLTGVHVVGNKAMKGGGVFTNEATVKIDRCTFSANDSSTTGGGISTTVSTVKVWNSTFSGNQATTGGGIFVDGGPLEVQNSTITRNNATNIAGGIGFRQTRPVLDSTIVAGNFATNPGDVESPDGSRHLQAADSLIGHVGRTQIDYLNDNVLVGEDPMLGALQDNGGQTPTHALLPGSPAINKGSNFAGWETDQRGPGYSRQVGAQADMGAFEFGAMPPRQAHGVRAQLVVVRQGRQKVQMVRIFDAVTGQLKREVRSPFQGRQFKAVSVAAQDANGDGVSDSVVVTAKRGKRLVTSTLPA